MRLEQHDIVTLDEAESVDSLTKKLGDLLVNQKLRLTSAESCPAGNWRQHCAQQKIRPHFTVWGMSPLLMKPKQKSYAYNATVLPNIPPSAKRLLLKWHRALRIRLRSISA